MAPRAGKRRSFALELARRLEIDLHMISVEESPRFPASIDEFEEERAASARIFDKVVEKAKAQAQANGVAFTSHIVPGHPVPAIADFAHKGGYDLLVVGFMGHSALYNRMIGGTTDRLVEVAPCKVMVVK
jgi:nucleotide-binding universal stress UspA family protein